MGARHHRAWAALLSCLCACAAPDRGQARPSGNALAAVDAGAVDASEPALAASPCAGADVDLEAAVRDERCLAPRRPPAPHGTLKGPVSTPGDPDLPSRFSVAVEIRPDRVRSGTPFDLALTITNEGPNPEPATFSIDAAGWGVVYVDRRGHDDLMDVQLGAPIALPSAVVEGMSKGDKTIRVAIAKGGKARAVLHLIASRHTEPVKSTTRTHYAPRVVDRPLAPGNYEVRGWPMNGVTFDENWVLLAPPLNGAGIPQSSSVSREMLGAGKLFTIVP